MKVTAGSISWEEFLSTEDLCQTLLDNVLSSLHTAEHDLVTSHAFYRSATRPSYIMFIIEYVSINKRVYSPYEITKIVRR